MFKYKLKEDSQHLEGTFVPGVGEVKDGVLLSGRQIENPNFELISDTQVEQAPQHLNGVAPQATQPVAQPVPETVQQPAQPEQNQQPAPESESQS